MPPTYKIIAFMRQVTRAAWSLLSSLGNPVTIAPGSKSAVGNSTGYGVRLTSSPGFATC